MAHTKWTEAQRDAARERLLKRMTPEWHQKQSERGKLRRHTEEEKRKISESNRGKKMSVKARAKMSAAKKGIRRTEEEKRHLSEKLKGRVMSEETRRRMSEARKRVMADPEKRKALGQRTRRFWASLTPEEKSKIALPGRLACLEATRLREPTSIEHAVARELTDIGIKFEQQVLFKYYVADLYLPEHNMVIECDGDYWHSTPEMMAHDKKRDKWFTKHEITVVRLKERDIRANSRRCVEEALKGII